MGEMETKIQIGCTPSNENACTPEDYPLCSELKREMDIYSADEMVHGKNETGEEGILFLSGDEPMPKGARRLVDRDDPKTSGNDSEVDRAVFEKTLYARGFDDICRVHAPGKEKSESEYKWFAVNGLTTFLTFHNEELNRCHMLDKSDIELSVGEMKLLVPLLNLSTTDMATKPGYAPRLGPDGKFTTGLYHFTADETRLNQMLKQLDDTPFKLKAALMMTGTYFKLEEHIEKVKEGYDTQIDAMNFGEIMGSLGVILGGFNLLLMGVFLYIIKSSNRKQLAKTDELSKKQLDKQDEGLDLTRKMMLGDSDKNKLDKFAADLVEEQRARLAENILVNEIMGRDAEALEYMRRMARPEYANPLIVGESGVGKKEVAKRAAQLIALKDPRIPEPFKDGRVKGIYIVDPSAFGGGTGIRGDVPARVNELVNAMKGGYGIHFEEMADFLESGVSRDGSSEALGSLLKPHLTMEYSRWTGDTTTDNYREKILQHKLFRDHARRMPPMELGDIPVPVVEKIIWNKTVPHYVSWYGDVAVEHDAAKLIVNVAIENMEEDAHYRVDAAKQLLADTIEYAISKRRNGEVRVTVEDVQDVVEKQNGYRPESNFEFIDTSVEFDADKAAKEVSHGQAIRTAFEADARFAGLSSEAKLEAVRVAGSLLMGEEGSRFRAEDGSIKFKELAREVKGRMTEMPVSAAATTTPAASAPEPKPEPKPAEKPIDRGEAELKAQARIIRDRMIQEAQVNAADAKAKVGFDFRNDLTSEEQDMLARRAAEILDASMKSGEYKQYLIVEENRSLLRPGAAHKLLAEAMRHGHDMRTDLARRVGVRLEREGKKRGREDRADGKKGFIARIRDMRNKGK